MLYRILEGKTLGDLELQVAEHIENGWEPIGGVSVKAEDESNYVAYYQAMVKKGAS